MMKVTESLYIIYIFWFADFLITLWWYIFILHHLVYDFMIFHPKHIVVPPSTTLSYIPDNSKMFASEIC